MYCLSCLSITKPLAFASLPQNDSPPPIQTTHTTKPPMRRPTPSTLPRTQQRKRQQPSIAEIERAIGAGRYRDIDARELKEEQEAEFDFISLSFSGKFEGPVEKKLRETGEWLDTWTETEFRASGKKILMVTFQWILPIWMFFLLIACGVIKLPFSSPFIDDLIM
ncbi:probable NAD(P)H dehydrogenase subunit CRR3, chloroplastic [Juglans regia]|uniref:Probable NAD(P)H dehydrogenase subunit CRR3, chloroplastic n=2 Tax=Juglans regia TaxID=51240 RepID=A0A2I4F4N7_JUGRE|nr:probable NAD(P)H dehydrogenase subunit CRR3, chloroplastic [Juglans regia]